MSLPEFGDTIPLTQQRYEILTNMAVGAIESGEMSPYLGDVLAKVLKENPLGPEPGEFFNDQTGKQKTPRQLVRELINTNLDTLTPNNIGELHRNAFIAGTAEFFNAQDKQAIMLGDMPLTVPQIVEKANQLILTWTQNIKKTNPTFTPPEDINTLAQIIGEKVVPRFRCADALSQAATQKVMEGLIKALKKDIN